MALGRAAMSGHVELYACVYAQEFPAQAMLRLRPELRERPVAVMEGEPPMQEGTVLEGMACRVEVARQLFAANAEKVVSIRKPPQSLGVAIWRSRTAWGGRR